MLNNDDEARAPPRCDQKSIGSAELFTGPTQFGAGSTGSELRSRAKIVPKQELIWAAAAAAEAAFGGGVATGGVEGVTGCIDV
jgi:hypothetical protein